MIDKSRINKTYYFISDLHIGIESIEKENGKFDKLTHFFNILKSDRGDLFILGDLFDYWFEYKYVIQKNSVRVINLLMEIKKFGSEIYYIIGNHDFSHIGYFENELGVKVIKNDLSVELNYQKFHISHGDGLNPKDYGYLFIKSVLKRKCFQKAYSFIHPDIGIGIAKYSSSKSRKYTSNKKFEDIKYIQDFLLKKSEENYDFVVLGHTHQRIETKINQCNYINLGSWFQQPCYGKFKEKFEILDL